VFYERETKVVVGVCAIGVAERIEDAQGCSQEASVASELHRHHLHVGLAWQFVENIASKAPRINRSHHSNYLNRSIFSEDLLQAN
jgi:hypothetical protein